jgi:hypothetical protein
MVAETLISEVAQDINPLENRSAFLLVISTGVVISA